MDCQTSNDLLLDLAYGELDEVRAAAVRKHAEGCAECRPALRRLDQARALARQLPREEPPPISDALRAAIAQAATPVAAGVPAMQRGGAEVVPMAPRRHGRLSRWLDRAGELAMRRQVAMAAPGRQGGPGGPGSGPAMSGGLD